MSTETATSSTDHNAQAADDANKMLAELQQNEPAKESTTSNEVANEQNTIDAAEERKPRNGDRSRDDRHDGGRRGDGFRGRGRGGRGRGGSKFDHKNHKNNIKSDLTSQEVTDDPVAIRKQVEFYFSDSNLPMDKFLLGKVGGSQNNPVELKTIHSFKRMRRFQPFEAIVQALKESEILDLTDDDTCVKRKEPLPEALNDGPNPEAVQVFEDKAMPRSVYAKGFGDEVPSTQFDIEAFFAPYGPTNAIRLRRTDEKIFKRSVFVEFETEELAKKFLELDPMPKFKEKDLLVMSKKEYCDKKVEDIKSGKIKPNRGSDGRNGRDFKRKRDTDDNRDWRERREEDRKNGFRDDKRRNGRDGRSKPDAESRTGKTNGSSENTAKADALAKARAVVEQEAKKDEQAVADNVEQAQQGSKDVKASAADVVAESIKADSDAATKKRPREEDDTGDTERDNKKVDTKTEG